MPNEKHARYFVKTEKILANPERYQLWIRAQIVFNDIRTCDALFRGILPLPPSLDRFILDSFVARAAFSQAFEAAKLITAISKDPNYADILDIPVVAKYWNRIQQFIIEDGKEWLQPMKGMKYMRHKTYGHYSPDEITKAVPRLASRADYDCAFADLSESIESSTFYYAEGIVTEIVCECFEIERKPIKETNAEIGAIYESASILRGRDFGSFFFQFVVEVGERDDLWTTEPPKQY